MFNLKTRIKILVGVSIVILLFSNSVSMYNTSVSLKTSYQLKVNQQITTFDADYLSFKQQSNGGIRCTSAQLHTLLIDAR
jgi:hypothetical protein